MDFMKSGVSVKARFHGVALALAALSLNGTWNLDYRLEEEKGEWSRVTAEVPCDGYLALQTYYN